MSVLCASTCVYVWMGASVVTCQCARLAQEYVHIYVCVHTFVCACLLCAHCVHICSCVRVHTGVCISVCVCVLVHAHLRAHTIPAPTKGRGAGKKPRSYRSSQSPAGGPLWTHPHQLPSGGCAPRLRPRSTGAHVPLNSGPIVLPTSPSPDYEAFLYMGHVLPPNQGLLGLSSCGPLHLLATPGTLSNCPREGTGCISRSPLKHPSSSGLRPCSQPVRAPCPAPARTYPGAWPRHCLSVPLPLS